MERKFEIRKMERKNVVLGLELSAWSSGKPGFTLGLWHGVRVLDGNVLFTHHDTLTQTYVP